MKHFSLFLLFFLLPAAAVFSQRKPAHKAKPALENQTQQYWFVLMKEGANTDADSTSKVILFEKHQANMVKLYYDGILKVSGPFGKNDNQWSGLFIFDCATREEAEDFVQTDPAIAAGLLTAEITPWFTAPVGSFVQGKPAKAIK